MATERERRIAGLPSKVEIASCVRHVVPLFGEEPQYGPDTRVHFVYFVQGTSHGDPFGAVVVAPGHLAPRVEMYGRERFERQETSTTGLLAMTMRRELIEKTVEHPEAADEAAAAELVARLREEGRTLFSGERIELDVPFADRDKAKELGAKWDPAGRCWYAMSGLSDHDALSEWTPRALAPA